MRPHRWPPTRLPCPWDSPGKNTRVGCHFLLQCMEVKTESEVAQSCLTPSDPMDCSLPGSSIHGIFQARVLEWGAIASKLLISLSPFKTSTAHIYLLDLYSHNSKKFKSCAHSTSGIAKRNTELGSPSQSEGCSFLENMYASQCMGWVAFI